MYFWTRLNYAKTEPSTKTITKAIATANSIYKIAAGAYRIP